MTTNVIISERKNPGCLIQLLWFVFIGWWAGQIWILLAWLLMLTILGIPLAVKMINNLPKVFALRNPSPEYTIVRFQDGVAVVSTTNVPQRNIFLRIIYFLLVGWWFSAIWMELAYLICLTIIGLPLGFWMFDRTPATLSLRR